MNTLYDVTVLEKLVDFICTYALDRTAYELRTKIGRLRGCIVLMTKYNQIPEVWVSKVHVLLRNADPVKEMGGVLSGFINSELFSGELKDECRNGWEYLQDAVLEFEDARDEWMFYHPREGNLHSAIHKWQRRHVQLLIL